MNFGGMGGGSTPRRSAFPVWGTRVLVLALLVGVRLAGGALMGHWFPNHRSYWNHNTRGNDDYAQGDWGGAVEEYTQMVQIDPNRVDGYALRGMAYYKMGQYRLAAADHRQAIALTPASDPTDIATSYQNLAYSEDYYGDHRQAIRDFTEAIRLDPSIPDKPGWTADADDNTGDSHKGRMWAYYATHQYALALKDCDALIARHPYPSSLAVRGKINREAGNFAQAKADFDAAIRQDPHLVNAYGWEEEMLERHGQMPAALALARKAVQQQPFEHHPRWESGFHRVRSRSLPTGRRHRPAGSGAGWVTDLGALQPRTGLRRSGRLGQRAGRLRGGTATGESR